ncbi:hypothetical protein [Thiorhodovibrio frisius]|uniref:Uncharacterized protein n=1 Tax=Thiorhodovibrio frisius TaxID=631362 RepID=H8Z532_9GAMM|nr:hypothetical protein [Thiorhodovibrio frisius]EIC20439.1 hypothetical protein Thi970DRAFT_04075 [Thiorhodovibrio frisius]WPL21182.1 hypothetical protein Thiofri_01293 [Thiorhodovibrio frisius]
MLTTVEATIDEQGQVRLLRPVRTTGCRRALVTVLDEDFGLPNTKKTPNITLMSESALGEDWNRSEEDEAWAHLQE